MSVTPVTYSRYEFWPEKQWSSPIEIACKQVSAQQIALLRTGSSPQRNMTLQCLHMNEQAVSIAFALIEKFWPSAIERFCTQGRPFVLLPDASVAAGPEWIVESLRFDINATMATIGSVALFTSTDAVVYAGNHYCKLLSPSRMIEYLMTHSLKNRY